MVNAYPRPVVAAAHPFLRFVTAFPVACFTIALATDIAYAETQEMMWADFSAWLLAIGVLMGLVAIVAAIVDAVAARQGRGAGLTWPGVIGGLLVLGVAVLNNLFHSRDAWTSVVPMGLMLSAVTVVLMLLTGVLGTAAASRRQLRTLEVRP